MRTVSLGSEAQTEGVTIRVTPRYLPDQSDPSEPRYVFGYHIDVQNGGHAGIRILSRHWTIIDGDGEVHEVEGEGVVGLQPHIPAGESFHYGSFCPLRTEWGTMEGVYHAVRDNGTKIDLRIARFYLVRPGEDIAEGSSDIAG